MWLTISIGIAYILDLLIGDPSWIPHPVVWMGRCIGYMEGFMRRVFPDTPKGKRLAGTVLAFLLPAGTLCLSTAAIWGCFLVHPKAAFVLNTFWCFQSLAVRDMIKESRNVARELTAAGSGSLDAARKAVARIVGRDTEELDEAGIIRAVVETVAENFSDGVFAPLFYMMIGGAPLALAYKSVNTMDSMIGYINEKYADFGRAAAKLDDAVNFIPSRLAALILVAAAYVCEGKRSAADALRIWRRDRRKHPSPNSAQTESVAAGALGIRLLGPTRYFGKIYDKEWIGDGVFEIRTGDIERINRIFMAGSFIALIVLGAMRILLWCFIK